MKTLLIIVTIVCCSSLAIAQHDMKNMQEMNTQKKPATAKTIYTCVMHPQIHKDKPGNCPICGMKLVKKTIKVAKPQSKPPKKDEMLMSKDTLKSKKDDMHIDMPMTNKTEVENEEIKMPAGEMPKVIIQKGKMVRYDLFVTDTMVNFTGKIKHAYAVNGSIPAPTLTFTEGDTAEIYLHNMLKSEETSLHWHGVILPNEADGVPYLTTAPIAAGETHLYKFPIVQNGTYWYHSHTELQEQAGMYGALIFKKREERQMEQMGKGSSDMQIKNSLFDAEYTLVLSEWTDEKPKEVQRRLRTANDWSAIKKGSTQSYAEAVNDGQFSTKVINEWKRMKAMDVSDVYYDRFLVNGKPENEVPQFKAGDKVKLHIVNSGASSYFWLQYAGGKITVVANDGNDIEPVEVDRMIIAVAETYDVIVTIPENMSYEFKATAEDRTKSTSLWLGSGMKMPASVLPKLKYFAGMKMMNGMMNMNGDMKNMDMQMSLQQMDMNSVMYPEITGSGKLEGNIMMDMNDIKNGKMNNMEHMHINEQKKDSMPGMKMDEMKDMHNMQMDSTKDTQMHEMNMDSGKDMKMGDMKNMQMDNMQGMNMSSSNSGIVTLNYAMLRSPFKTTLPDAPTKTMHFNLTGNMNRYVWTIDNKTVNESDKILIKDGENVRIIITNNSMMRHPMHLHGHDFRVLNGQGEYAPLKNVLDIMPIETDTIEFAANKSGDWFFHCHILYHMMAGMGNVFSYVNSSVNPELPDSVAAYKGFKKDNTMIHPMVKVGLESNGSDGEYMLSSNRYSLQGLWHLGYSPHHGYETELNFGRYFGKMQWLFPYVGFDYHYKKEGMFDKNIFGTEKDNLFGQISNKNDRKTFVAGVQYTLPMLFIADARIDGNGKFRFQLGREDVPVTNRLRFNIMANTDKEYMTGLKYIITKWLSLSTHYDSDMGLGAGVTLNY